MMELKFMIRYRYRLQTPILSKDNCKNIVSNIKYFLKQKINQFLEASKYLKMIIKEI